MYISVCSWNGGGWPGKEKEEFVRKWWPCLNIKAKGYMRGSLVTIYIYTYTYIYTSMFPFSPSKPVCHVIYMCSAFPCRLPNRKNHWLAFIVCVCVEYSLSLSSILVMENIRRKRERSWTLTVWGFFFWAHRNGQESLTDDNSNCQSHPSLWPQTPRYTRRIRREETVDRGCGPSLKPKKDDHFQPLSRLPGVLTREKVALCSRW